MSRNNREKFCRHGKFKDNRKGRSISYYCQSYNTGGMMKIDFREGPPATESYFALYATTGWNVYYKATLSEVDSSLRNSWYTVCAYSDNTLIGFGRILSDGILYGVICDMIVATEFQKKGIGSEILNRLKIKCITSGLRTIWLFAAEGKENFYAHHGFSSRPQAAPGMQLKLY